MLNKKKYGQFYTTNVDYILQNLTFPGHVSLIEPFAGNGDILKWIGNDNVELYDIDPKIKKCEKRDTLKNPPNYTNKFVITNPPYLAKNKTKDKEIFDNYETDDLYKASIISFIRNNVIGGILIVPLNFISQHSNKLRKLFFEKYHITKMNIFEEKVFDDTGYTVCSFEFHRGKKTINTIDTTIYPINKKIILNISEYEEWSIGRNFFPKMKSKYNIRRLVEGDGIPNNNMFLHAIDGGNINSRIRLVSKPNHLYGKGTDRSFCSFWSDAKIDNEEYVISEFNKRLEYLRDTNYSLFLTNYRESSDIYARKRMGFNQAYSLIEQILSENTNQFF
jgi:hypothetical protein